MPKIDYFKCATDLLLYLRPTVLMCHAMFLSAKERVMTLIESEHKDVQRQALQCISKIMVNKWEFVR